ncbi:MAG: hypothetical protein EAY75_12090 [Bacteroidetes bacterium]|nr:MAG: hypothetical protein EAY75_12090 [Bacteroidota bacterium]
MSQFSPEDLLEYFYGEAAVHQQEAIAEALKKSWALNQKMNVITKAAEQLDKSMHEAPAHAVAQVIAYARQRQHSLID